MQPNVENFHSGLMDKAKANKHLIMGYFFLALVFAGAISSVYYWENQAAAVRSADQAALPRNVGSGVQAPEAADDTFCAQVITPARHRMTGEVREFPTPCDVLGDWEIYR